LKDAFPINVNQLDLNWSNENFHKLNVTFAYTYWTNDLTPDSLTVTSGSSSVDVQGSATSVVDTTPNS
jgi:hypothetical protein